MRRTKIVATIGPACESTEKVRQMLQAGVDVVRLNFSHGDHSEHERSLRTVRQVAEELRMTVGVLQDLSGPKIRIGPLQGETVYLRRGARFVLTTNPILGNDREVSVSYKGLPGDVKPGDTLLLADGALSLQVDEIRSQEIVCRVTAGGDLSSHQGVNFPGGVLHTEGFTEKDREDLDCGMALGVDWVALSFVREARDVARVKDLLHARGAEIPVIAKIEKHEALLCLDEILDASDGAMVARGDLGVEIPLEQVPWVQKQIIEKCRERSKPVITATHMLRSMVSQPRPTRAEAGDVTTAVLDGTDAVMLSEETAVGNYPVESVAVMARIAEMADSHRNREGIFQERKCRGSIPDAISHAACVLAQELQVKAILTPTSSGSTSRRISSFRPAQPILAMSQDSRVLRRLALSWGVTPVAIPQEASVEELISTAVSVACSRKFVQKGEKIVVTSGVPLGVPGTTNMIEVLEA